MYPTADVGFNEKYCKLPNCPNTECHARYIYVHVVYIKCTKAEPTMTFLTKDQIRHCSLILVVSKKIADFHFAPLPHVKPRYQ